MLLIRKDYRDRHYISLYIVIKNTFIVRRSIYIYIYYWILYILYKYIYCMLCSKWSELMCLYEICRHVGRHWLKGAAWPSRATSPLSQNFTISFYTLYAISRDRKRARAREPSDDRVRAPLVAVATHTSRRSFAKMLSDWSETSHVTTEEEARPMLGDA